MLGSLATLLGSLATLLGSESFVSMINFVAIDIVHQTYWQLSRLYWFESQGWIWKTFQLYGFLTLHLNSPKNFGFNLNKSVGYNGTIQKKNLNFNNYKDVIHGHIGNVNDKDISKENENEKEVIFGNNNDKHILN